MSFYRNLCTSALVLALLAFSTVEAAAQNAGRAASGEKRVVDTSKDKQAYNTLKTHVSEALNEVMRESEIKITAFNGRIDEITELVEEIEEIITLLEDPANWHAENDPLVKAQADERDLNGTSIPICNPQIHELVFDHNTSRWNCTAAGNACMASQSVWR